MSSSIQIAPEVSVSFQGRRLRITHILDLETILAADEATGALERLFIKDVAPADEAKAETDVDKLDTELVTVDKKGWEEANRRYTLIKPLLEAPRRTREMVEEQARTGGVHPVTLYRWIDTYLCAERVSALLPNKRGFKKGQSRLSPEVEAVLNATIEDFYLNKQKHSVQDTCDEVENRCRNAGLPIPHPNTIRNRIAVLSEKAKIARRKGQRAASSAFDPVRGRFPGADFLFSLSLLRRPARRLRPRRAPCHNGPTGGEGGWTSLKQAGRRARCRSRGCARLTGRPWRWTA